MADYMTCTALTDAGPFVTRLLLSMPEEVAAGAAGPGTFSVFVQRRNRTTGELISLNRKTVSPEVLADAADGLSQGYWPVRAVYPWGETAGLCPEAGFWLWKCPTAPRNT